MSTKPKPAKAKSARPTPPAAPRLARLVEEPLDLETIPEHKYVYYARFSVAVERAKEQAAEDGGLVQFEWNQCTIVVAADSDIGLIERDLVIWTKHWGWQTDRDDYESGRKRPLLEDTHVGPYPTPELSPEVQRAEELREARLEIARRTHGRARQLEAEARHLDAEYEVEVRLFDAPPFAMKPGSELFFLNSRLCGDYGYEFIHEWMVQWGRLMQREIDNGLSVAEAADRTEPLMRDLHEDGWMYHGGQVKAAMSYAWVHGDALAEHLGIDAERFPALLAERREAIGDGVWGLRRTIDEIVDAGRAKLDEAAASVAAVTQPVVGGLGR